MPGPSCSKHRKLNELVKGYFVNCFSGFNIQYSDIFCWKNVSSFCKFYHHIFFSKNTSIYAIFNDQSYNDTLTNDIVSFEQLGPDVLWIKEFKKANSKYLTKLLLTYCKAYVEVIILQF